MIGGSLYSGSLGMDLGFEQAGVEFAWYVEKDPHCRKLIGDKRPGRQVFQDVRDFLQDDYSTVDIICGGDPCPSRSLAKGSRKSAHPDLSGYFLAVVGRYSPRWVVRENVPAPDAVWFAAGLEALGYGIIAIALDARDFTSQSRRRQYIIGCPPEYRADFQRTLFDAADGFGFVASNAEEKTPIAACLTAHPSRMAAEDSYVFDAYTFCLATTGNDQWEGGNYLYQGGALRTLSPEECEGLQGFPRGWTAGFSRSRRRIMCGNAVNTKAAFWIGDKIVAYGYTKNLRQAG